MWLWVVSVQYLTLTSATVFLCVSYPSLKGTLCDYISYLHNEFPKLILSHLFSHFDSFKICVDHVTFNFCVPVQVKTPLTLKCIKTEIIIHGLEKDFPQRFTAVLEVFIT